MSALWNENHNSIQRRPFFSEPQQQKPSLVSVSSIEEAAKLLEDYCLPRTAYWCRCFSGPPETGIYGSFFRFFSGRWNRHHIQAVSNVLAQYHNEEIGNLDELRHALKMALGNTTINPTGDLAHILQKLDIPISPHSEMRSP